MTDTPDLPPIAQVTRVRTTTYTFAGTFSARAVETGEDVDVESVSVHVHEDDPTMVNLTATTENSDTFTLDTFTLDTATTAALLAAVGAARPVTLDDIAYGDIVSVDGGGTWHLALCSSTGGITVQGEPCCDSCGHLSNFLFVNPDALILARVQSTEVTK